MKRLIFAIGISLGLIIASVPSAPAASAFTWGVHEFNMQTNASAAAYAVLTIGASSDPPWYLGFSEVCNLLGPGYSNLSDMADWIEYHLGPVGYSTQVTNYLVMAQYSNACPAGSNANPNQPSDNGKLGVLSYTRGPGSASRVTYFSSPSGGYNEGAVCAESLTYLGAIVSCSTHLYNGSGAQGQAQAEELRSFASLAYPGLKKVLLGDFNLRPIQVQGCPQLPSGGTAVPAGYYTNYYEANWCTNSPTRQTNIKNDFIFGAKNTFNCFGTSSITPTGYSDHYYYAGLFCS